MSLNDELPPDEGTVKRNKSADHLPPGAISSLQNYTTSSFLERASWNGRRRSDVWDMKAINRNGEKIQASNIRGEKSHNRACHRLLIAPCCCRF